MADPKSTTLPPALRGHVDHVKADEIDIPEERSRTPDLRPASIGELAASIKRQGLQQLIGVKHHGDRYLLIWGRRRLEAYRTQGISSYGVPCMVYPEDLPMEWSKILEIDENARRQDLTPDERSAHTLELAAEIKKIESQGEAANSDKSDFAPPTTGRGHKGIVQKVAERQNVDQAAVRKRAQKVADTIGEPVDLQKDTPEELTRKAAKFREAPKARRVRKIDDVRRAFPDGRMGYVASERGFDAMREDMAKAATEPVEGDEDARHFVQRQRINATRHALEALAAQLPRMDDVAAVVGKMTEGERRNLARLMGRVADRFNWLWRELGMGRGPLDEPTVAQLETAAAPKAEQTGDPVTPVNDAELRAWAKGQDIDRLAKHVGPAGYTSNDARAKIERFLDGKALHYKLRGALEQVRKDLARYNRPS